MDKKLIPLSDWNDERADWYDGWRTNKKDVPNGLACPECGKELLDRLPGLIRGYPPTTDVLCDCGFVGERVV